MGILLQASGGFTHLDAKCYAATSTGAVPG
jgi:hypothetical protein